MRIAIVYDCMYPQTVGGAERWYRRLADRLAERHTVTYLTRRQWERGQPPETDFKVVAVSKGGPLYTAAGRRKILPPVRFGLGVFWHLLRYGRRYDVVDCASFPYFSLIGAWLALMPHRRTKLVADWFECWSRDYWIEYLGRIGGGIGYAVQKLCLKVTDRAFTFSATVAHRLRAEGYKGELTHLPGLYDGPADTGQTAKGADPPLVVFAGRHIPEKRVATIPEAIALARESVPGLRGAIYGDGPEYRRVRERIAALGLAHVIECPGFVDSDVVEQAMDRALCLVLPSRREGYGLVVVEACARGTPVVVSASPESAATDLVVEGENGFIATTAKPDDLAAAIVRVHRRGQALRESTAAWFAHNAERLSMANSVNMAERFFFDSARRGVTSIGGPSA